jgi:Na+-driven multidrug efflux pump
VFAEDLVSRRESAALQVPAAASRHEGDGSESPLEVALARVTAVSWLWVAAGSAVSVPLLFHADVAKHVVLSNGKQISDSVAAGVAAYGRQFSWGVFPTLLLYFADQLCLGVQATGLAFVYGGLLYAVVATVVAGVSYSSTGPAGLGMGMSVGAWVALMCFGIHVALDPRLRSALITAPIALLHRLVVVRAEGEGGKLAVTCTRFLRLALPLSLSNCLGLLRGLIVSAAVTSISSEAATAYSVATAYYQTLEIALLGASSAVSSVAARQRRTSTVAAINHHVLSRSALAVNKPLAFAALSVLVLATLLGALPLVLPAPFASFFGGDVYAFGTSTVNAVSADDLRRFTWVSFTSFAAATVAMTASAVMHGWGVVVLPTAVNFVANAAGLAWAIAFNGCSRCGDTAVFSSPLCNGVAAVLQAGLLVVVVAGGRAGPALTPCCRIFV